LKILKYINEVLGVPTGIDKLISQAEVIDHEGRKAVKKVFTREIGIIKWLPPTLLFRPVYPFTFDPRERFRRELNFMNLGSQVVWRTFSTPAVLSADEGSLTIIREFIDGSLIDYGRDADLLASALAEVHSKNYVLGDVKPTNFVVYDGTLYIIDAEQAVESSSIEHRAWDLALNAFFMSYIELWDVQKYKNLMRRFLKKYLASGGSTEPVKNITSIKLSSISLLMPLPHLVALVRIIEELL